MGFFSKLFGKKADNDKANGMENYMQLVRVYFQASIAANVGIANLAMLPRPACVQVDAPRSDSE